jgi:hypothetical protein
VGKLQAHLASETYDPGKLWKYVKKLPTLAIPAGILYFQEL